MKFKNSSILMIGLLIVGAFGRMAHADPAQCDGNFDFLSGEDDYVLSHNGMDVGLVLKGTDFCMGIVGVTPQGVETLRLDPVHQNPVNFVQVRIKNATREFVVLTDAAGKSTVPPNCDVNNESSGGFDGLGSMTLYCVAVPGERIQFNFQLSLTPGNPTAASKAL